MIDLRHDPSKDTPTTLTLEWDPVPGATGYRFSSSASVKRSHTWDPTRTSVRFSKGADWYSVEALGVVDEGVWPAAEPPPPPVNDFGTKLHQGFEWVLKESPEPVVPVATVAELQAALSRSGAIIDGGGRTFNLGGQLSLPAVSALTTLQNATLTGGRIDKSNSAKWRIRGCDISLGSPEDNVKGSSGAFLHLDHCRIHHAPRQGVLLYPHSDFVMSNCRVYENGSTTNQDHGIYAGEGSRLLIYNCAFYNNQAYQGQFYPHYHEGLVVCCTFYGGRTRGGVVIGSEGSDPVSDLRFVGVICANNSHGWGFEAYGTLGPGIVLEDCLGWANSSGDFDNGAWTVRRPHHGDPKFVDPANGDFRPGPGSAAKGIIDPALYPLIPATDIDGIARTSENVAAGAHTAAGEAQARALRP